MSRWVSCLVAAAGVAAAVVSSASGSTVTASGPAAALSLPTVPIELPVSAIDGSMMITRTRVTLQSDLLFAFDSSALSVEARARVAEAADAIQQRKPRAIEIAGYTDSRGTADYNTRLSRRRAEAVRAVLAKSLGPAVRIDAAGRGEAAPVASNATARGRSLNRRVEIRLR
jgi:OmpA-OmpF porin, OOP family